MSDLIRLTKNLDHLSEALTSISADIEGARYHMGVINSELDRLASGEGASTAKVGDPCVCAKCSPKTDVYCSKCGGTVPTGEADKKGT